MLRRAVWLTGLGLGVGLALAFVLAHGVANLLYEASPSDPAIFASIFALIAALIAAAIAAAIAAVGMLASWLPARRASRIDAIVALRDE